MVTLLVAVVVDLMAPMAHLAEPEVVATVKVEMHQVMVPSVLELIF